MIVALRGYDKSHGYQENVIEKATLEKEFYELSVFDRLEMALASSLEEEDNNNTN